MTQAQHKMHDDEFKLDDEIVRRLLAAQFPEWSSLPIRAVASTGTDNALFRLGDDMVVRLPKIHWAAATAARCYHWLPMLAPSLPVDVPLALALGEPTHDFPWQWTVCRWLEGENPVVGKIEKPLALAEGLADCFRAMWSCSPPNDAPLANRGVPLSAKDVQTRQCIEALTVDLGMLGQRDAEDVTALWEAALRLPVWSGQPRWLHGDVSSGNILCIDGTLSAMIDWGGVGIGDPASDLAIGWNALPVGVRPAFRAALGVDDAMWLRGRAWALLQALVQLPYYFERNPFLANNARYVIREILAEHRVRTVD